MSSCSDHYNDESSRFTRKDARYLLLVLSELGVVENRRVQAIYLAQCAGASFEYKFGFSRGDIHARYLASDLETAHSMATGLRLQDYELHRCDAQRLAELKPLLSDPTGALCQSDWLQLIATRLFFLKEGRGAVIEDFVSVRLADHYQRAVQFVVDESLWWD